MNGNRLAYQDDRGAVALMTAIMAPALLLMVALIVDTGFWVIGSIQLQIAADAGAMGAGQLLSSSLKTANTSTQQANLKAAAAFEASQAATKLLGTINTSVTAASDFSYVTVSLTSQAPSYLIGVTALVPPFTAITPPLLYATATATLKGGPKPCILALATSGTGIEVDGSGVMAATSCPIFSNSTGNPSIHASGSGSISESGAISGVDIGASGTIASDNGGSISAATVTQNMSPVADYVAGSVATPVGGTCTTGQSDFSDSHNGQAYNITPTTWCNVNVNIGGNGNTVNLAAGTYYISNGNLTFNNNGSLTLASGVSFALIGSSPGNFTWGNGASNANPITGGTNGIAIWMSCNSSGSQTATFNGGATLSITGIIYMPCAAVSMSNASKATPPSNQVFTYIAKSFNITGSAQLRAQAGSTSTNSSAAGPVLTQ